MSENSPWRKFRVDPKGDSPNDCAELSEVSHVAHLEAAHRIVVDGRIRAGLVFDKSVLNRDRVLVAWLSPNYWNHGFRYGSVQFKFDWRALVEGHKAYWVESMAYGVTACRILLTKNDYANHPQLIPYDPTEGNGPWWFDEASGTHYWNGEHCLEFMIEHDIEFSALTDIDFVEHHKKQCNIDPKTCPERGVPRGLAAARFLSRLAAHGVGLPEIILSDPQKLSSFRMSRAHALFYMKERISALAKEFSGPFAADNPNSISICRGILNAYAVSTLHAELPALAALFCSQEDLMACCASLIASATGVALEPPDALRQTRRRPF